MRPDRGPDGRNGGSSAPAVVWLRFHGVSLQIPIAAAFRDGREPTMTYNDYDDKIL